MIITIKDNSNNNIVDDVEQNSLCLDSQITNIKSQIIEQFSVSVYQGLCLKPLFGFLLENCPDCLDCLDCLDLRANISACLKAILWAMWRLEDSGL